MPAPLDVDREALEVLVKAVGVREAARQTGIAVPTLGAMSSRNGWLRQAQADAAPSPEMLPPSMRPVHTVHTKPSEAMGNALRELGDKTKSRLARGLARGALTVAHLKGSAVLDRAQQVKALADAGAKLHGWDKADGAPTSLLGIAVTVSHPSQTVDVEATVTPMD